MQLELAEAGRLAGEVLPVLEAVGRVDDEQVLVVDEAVQIGVVDGAAALVGDDRVLRLADLEGGGVVGQDVLQEGQRVGAADEEAPHVGDVEQAGRPAGREVLGDDAAGVVERHLPAGEVDHAPAGRHVALVRAPCAGARPCGRLRLSLRAPSLGTRAPLLVAGQVGLQALEPLDDLRRVDARVGEAHVLLALAGPRRPKCTREQTETPVSCSTARRKVSTSVEALGAHRLGDVGEQVEGGVRAWSSGRRASRSAGRPPRRGARAARRRCGAGPLWSPVRPSRAPYWMKWLGHDSSLTLSLAMTSTTSRGPIAAPSRQPVMANFLENV